MKFKKYLLLIFCIVAMSTVSCSRNANRPFTEEDIIKIYVAIEFSTEAEAEKAISTYNLTNDITRRNYYNTVKELTDTPEKNKEFVTKVEQYKQNLFADENSIVKKQ